MVTALPARVAPWFIIKQIITSVLKKKLKTVAAVSRSPFHRDEIHCTSENRRG